MFFRGMYNFVHSLNNATCIYPRFSKLLCIYIYLVGSVPTPLKNMISSVGVIIPKYMESQKNSCSKPPTRWWWLLSHYIDDYYPITWILWVMYIYILQLCRWNPAEISLFGNTESESKSSIPAITGCIQVWVYQTQHKPW